MRYITLALIGTAAAVPVAQFDLGALINGLGGGAKNGAGGADPLAGLGALLGGAGGAGGLGDLLGGLLGGGDGGPTGDVGVILGEYEKIKNVVQAQDAFVEKIGDKPPADLIAQLNKLGASQVDALKSATKAIDGMAGVVDIMSAAGLQGPGGELTVATEKSIENLKKNVAAISKIPGAREAELKNLNAMLEATKAFNEAVNKKLPSLAQAVATQESQKSVDYLTDAIKAFGGKV